MQYIENVNILKIHYFISAWGRCSHAFHLHCVLKWLDTEHANNKCPICRQNWELRVY
jgi:hypothetical protein